MKMINAVSTRWILIASLVIVTAAAFSASTRSNRENYENLQGKNVDNALQPSKKSKAIQPEANSSSLNGGSNVQVQPAAGSNQQTQDPQPQPQPSGYYPDDQIYPQNPEPCKNYYSERPCLIPPP